MSKNSEYVRRSRHKRRELIQGLKQKPCKDCGGEFPSPVMHFHHVRGEKKFTIANAVRTNKSLTSVLEEIAKCDLVCANCHTMRHLKI